MSTHAGPSRLGQSSARLQPQNPRPLSSREEVDLTALVARLSDEDIDQIEARHNGKQRQGAVLTDAELALSIFAEDARTLKKFNSDRALAEAMNEGEEPRIQTAVDEHRRVPAGTSTRSVFKCV